MSRSLNAQATQNLMNFVIKKKSAVQMMTKVVLQRIAVSLVERSPIGNPALWKRKYWPAGYVPGQFINNWQMGVDAIPHGTLEWSEPTGKAAITRMHKSIPRWPVGHTYYFTNNLPYARLLETGLHSSQVGPGGMVALTFAEIPQYVRDAEIEYAKGS